MRLQAPFPYFGGKSIIADAVWQRFGAVGNFVDPFCGSLAVLLRRPGGPDFGHETVNDKDGFVSNFWRAVKDNPDAVAEYADWPVNENDLTARHIWLVQRKESIVERLEGDPEWYDAKIAGWWVWGISCWIGSGWCSGTGPWTSVDGKLVHLSGARGVNRKLVHLSRAQGVNRKRVQLGNGGIGVHSPNRRDGLDDWMKALADRLRNVRVCCGDWTRVVGPSPTYALGLTAVFLDPPYSHAERTEGLYAEDLDIAAAVRDWALANGDNPLLRIAFCGYDGEHEFPPTWEKYQWKSAGGYGSQGEGRGRENRRREAVWCSPACQKAQLL